MGGPGGATEDFLNGSLLLTALYKLPKIMSLLSQWRTTMLRVRPLVAATGMGIHPIAIRTGEKTRTQGDGVVVAADEDKTRAEGGRKNKMRGARRTWGAASGSE